MDTVPLSGMRAASQAMRTSAYNLANLQTPGFRRERVVNSTQADGGVVASTTRAEAPGSAIETDLIEQLQARNAFLANLAVFRSNSRVRGSLLDLYA
jgi:flagellar hook-associated protein FlgK